MRGIQISKPELVVFLTPPYPKTFLLLLLVQNLHPDLQARIAAP